MPIARDARNDRGLPKPLQALSNSLQPTTDCRGARTQKTSGFSVEVIDKLEFRVENHKELGVPFTAEFEKLFASVRNSPEHNPFRPSRHYQLVGDMREFGHDVVLHLWNKHSKIGSHKIELMDVGKRPLSRIVQEVESVFSVDALKLRIMRIDLATDLEGVSVRWCHDRARVRWKQWHAQFGKDSEIEKVQMGRGGIETLYFGKRPNLFRIYDKKAEYVFQYKQILKNVSHDQIAPSFRELFGIEPDGPCLTRFERQIGGGRVPEEISTLKRFRRNHAKFNPFEALDIPISGALEPRIEDYDCDTYLAGMYLRSLIQQHGYQWVYKYIQKKSGQGARTFRRFQDFVAPSSDSSEISSSQIFDKYLESTNRQIGC